jgi:hypothetical protein
VIDMIRVAVSGLVTLAVGADPQANSLKASLLASEPVRAVGRVLA